MNEDRALLLTYRESRCQAGVPLDMETTLVLKEVIPRGVYCYEQLGKCPRLTGQVGGLAAV